MSAPRRFGVDLTPLRVSAPFRRLFLYGALTVLASQMTVIAMLFQVKQLTHSTFDVGTLSAAELLPIIGFGLYGGVIADHWDRRKVMVFCELGFLLSMIALLVNARLAQPNVAALYILAALGASFGAAQGPSIASVTQQVISHDLQRQASTLSMIRSTGASIIGPLLGGVICAVVGAWLVYAIVLGFFCVTVVLLVGIKAQRVVEPVSQGALDALSAGLRYARTRPDILGSYVVDLIAMTLAFPVAVLAFTSDLFHSRFALGVLFAGIPFGAMLASLTSSWTAKIHHYGRAVIVAAAVWGLGIGLLGVAPNLWVAFLGLALAGAGDAISGIFRITMWNESIASDLRGRMGGMELLSYSVGPVLGNFRSGVTAGVMGLRTSIVAGGLSCSALVATASFSLRSFWNFDVRSDANVAVVKAQRAAELAQ